MYNFVSRGGLSSIWNKRKYQSINQTVSLYVGIIEIVQTYKLQNFDQIGN